jgi:hypothetical protein
VILLSRRFLPVLPNDSLPSDPKQHLAGILLRPTEVSSLANLGKIGCGAPILVLILALMAQIEFALGQITFDQGTVDNWRGLSL